MKPLDSEKEVKDKVSTFPSQVVKTSDNKKSLLSYCNE